MCKCVLIPIDTDVCHGRQCYEEDTCHTNEGACECKAGLRFKADDLIECIGKLSG